MISPAFRSRKNPLPILSPGISESRKARLGIEQLEKRDVPATDPVVLANSITHSAEYYSNFVEHAYDAYLDRAPDSGGLSNWINQMQQGLTDEWLEANFIGSLEYIQEHGGQGAGWVRGMYQDLLGRTPAQSEVDFWVNALNRGESPNQVAYGFAASLEREGNRVEEDYSIYLGRLPSQSEVDGWVASFQTGNTNENIVTGFIASKEYRARFVNDGAWVYGLYEEVLDRTPQPEEVASWGYSLTYPSTGSIGDKMVAFLQTQLPQNGVTHRLGGGECSHLANEALRVAGGDFSPTDPNNNDDYVWSTQFVTQITGSNSGSYYSNPSARIKPGDVIQYTNAKYDGHNATHHTSVVAAVDANGRVTSVFEQNIGKLIEGSQQQVRYVVRQSVDFSDLTAGYVKVYRPTARPTGTVEFTITNNTASSQSYRVGSTNSSLTSVNTTSSYARWRSSTPTVTVGSTTITAQAAAGYEIFTLSNGAASIRKLPY